MTSRWLPRAVLALGAAASIATSAPPPEWILSSGKTLPVGVLDQASAITYPIQIEIGGQESYVGLEGWMTATIRVAPRSVPAALTSVTVQLVSLSSSYASGETTITLEGDAARDVVLQVPAWTDCRERSCVEDFQLAIVRSEGADSPVLDISGSIEIDASGFEPIAAGQSDLVLTIGEPE